MVLYGPFRRPRWLCGRREGFAQSADHPGRAVANVFVRERQDAKTSQRQFRVSLGVDLTLSTRGVRTVTRDFDDQTTREVGVDPGNNPGSVSVGLLEHRSADSGLADQPQQPALEPALATSVDQCIKKKAAAVQSASMFGDHTRTQSLFGNQSESNRGVDRVFGLCHGEFELR